MSIAIIRRLFFAMTLCVLTFAQAAQANVIRLSTSGIDANDGSTWAAAKHTFLGALNAANAGDEIWVSAGTYVAVGITLKEGVSLYGGFAGTELSRGQRNAAANVTTISGASGSDTVLANAGISNATVVDGFTVKNGRRGFLCNAGSPTISNNTITGNQLTSSGGAGIYGSNSSPAILNNTITANSAPGGGAIQIIGGSPLIDGNTITGNLASYGGAIYLDTANAVITDNYFAQNAATTNGGCMYLYNTTATVERNQIYGNTASGGGALWVQGGGSNVSVLDCLLAGNAASGPGGAIYDAGIPLLNIRNNTIVANSAAVNAGGALYVYVPNEVIVNNIIAFNSSGIVRGNTGGNMQHGYNDVYGSAEFDYIGVAQSGTEFSLDPQFVDPAHQNYRLTNGSPCADAGNANGISPTETDLDGNARVIGNSVDIGCYEGATTTSNLISVSMLQPSAGPGEVVIGIVTLDAPAPTGGSIVVLHSSNPNLAPVPANVTVNQGDTTATFPITVGSTTTPKVVTINATLHGSSQSTSLKVLPWITSVAFSPASVQTGGISTVTVFLSAPAPAAGLPVTMAVSVNPALVTLSTHSLTIPAGARSASLTATVASGITARTSATVTATVGAQTSSANLAINPVITVVVAALAMSPTSLPGGNTGSGVVTLSGPAPAGGLAVALSSDNAAATVPGFVVIPQGHLSAGFSIPTSVVTVVTKANMSATLGGVGKKTALTVRPVAPLSIALVPNIVSAGDASIGVITLEAVAPAGGITVNLTSAAPGVALPLTGSVVIAAGTNSAIFEIDAIAAGSAKITASTAGGNKVATLTVKP